MVGALGFPFLKIYISQARIYMADLAVDLRCHAVQHDVMTVFIFSDIEENIAVICIAFAENISGFYILDGDGLARKSHLMRIMCDLLLMVVFVYPDGKSGAVALLLCLTAELIRPGSRNAVE